MLMGHAVVSDALDTCQSTIRDVKRSSSRSPRRIHSPHSVGSRPFRTLSFHGLSVSNCDSINVINNIPLVPPCSDKTSLPNNSPPESSKVDIITPSEYIDYGSSVSCALPSEPTTSTLFLIPKKSFSICSALGVSSITRRYESLSVFSQCFSRVVTSKLRTSPSQSPSSTGGFSKRFKFQGTKSITSGRTWFLVPFLLLMVAARASAGPRYSSRIVETQGGAIRGVILEPGSPHLEPVEAFRGVPYAAPPIAELRFRPPEAPLPWSGTRLADTFGAVCPQRPPDVTNRTAALMHMPRGRFLQLRRLVPLLRAQSENCLFLNLYVPGSGNRGLEAPYAVLVFVHGESFEWNSGNPYDGSVLASFGHVIVVTFNFRLGILGFLRTRPGPGAAGTLGGEPELALMDAVACLRWVNSNVAAFGGDPSRVTLFGHDTGAALVNLLLLSGAAAGLFQRAALLSGSALSPWAQQRRPEAVRAAVAAQLGCPPERDLAPCLRAQPLASLMAVRVAAPRFLPGFGPIAAPAAVGGSGVPGEAAAAAMERATGAFIASELLLGAASTESYLDLNEADVQYGLEEEQRDRVLRTYVRNAYEFHLSEIFSAVRNEYTDWSRPVQHPINLRDAALEALSDGHTVAPLLRVAYLHARRGAKTYFFHFGHQTRSSDYPQRLGSVRGEALPYLLGLPLAPGPPLLPHNYSRQDAAVAEAALTFLTNFAKTGNPNEPRVRHPDYGPARPRGLIWDPYEPSKQQYLSLTQKPRMRSHYRGHKMALWLNLIPQLHQPGGDDVSMRHHNFRERAEHFYSGLVRAESFTRPPPPPIPAGSAMGTARPGIAECTPNTTTGSPWDEDVVGVDEGDEEGGAGAEDEAGLLRRLATRHYYSYTAALGVTVGVGCLLLVLNMLVFAGVFYRRRRRGGSGSRGGGDGEGQSGERGQAAGAEAVPLSHCPASAHVIEVGCPPPCYNSTAKARTAEPPAPPARTSSNPLATGGPGSTATIKKRVQIQEISV